MLQPVYCTEWDDTSTMTAIPLSFVEGGRIMKLLTKSSALWPLNFLISCRSSAFSSSSLWLVNRVCCNWAITCNIIYLCIWMMRDGGYYHHYHFLPILFSLYFIFLFILYCIFYFHHIVYWRTWPSCGNVVRGQKLMNHGFYLSSLSNACNATNILFTISSIIILTHNFNLPLNQWGGSQLEIVPELRSFWLILLFHLVEFSLCEQNLSVELWHLPASCSRYNQVTN